MAGLQTEYEFFLPKGFVDDDGVVHRDGIMRLATARDELDPLRDPRVRDADDPFLTIIVLSRVVVRLGTITQITPREIERLFAADLAYLQDVYGAINFGTADDVADVLDDAQERAREAAEAERRPAVARTRRETVKAPAPTVIDEIDEIDEDEVDGDDDTIDADALAARLQAQFGDQGDDDDDEVEVVPARRRHIQEVGSRVG